MNGLNRYLAKYRALYEERLRQLTPEDQQKSRAHRAEFAKSEDITLQDSFRFAHILSVLESSENLEEAVDDLSSAFNASKMHIMDLVLQSVNNAPESWKNENQESLYEKGLIRGTSLFYKSKKFLGKDEIFGEYRRYVPAEMQPVLDVAIDCLGGSTKGDDLKISPTVLCLMMAYMVPEYKGAKILKAFESRKMANASIFEENVQRAKESISILFKKMDIPLSSLSPLAKSLQVQIKQEETSDQLERSLNGLGNAISPHEKNVYIAYVKNKTGNSVIDAMKVASLFNKRTTDIITHKEKVTPEFLRATIQKVETLLSPEATARSGDRPSAKTLSL